MSKFRHLHIHQSSPFLPIRSTLPSITLATQSHLHNFNPTKPQSLSDPASSWVCYQNPSKNTLSSIPSMCINHLYSLRPTLYTCQIYFHSSSCQHLFIHSYVHSFNSHHFISNRNCYFSQHLSYPSLPTPQIQHNTTGNTHPHPNTTSHLDPILSKL